MRAWSAVMAAGLAAVDAQNACDARAFGAGVLANCPADYAECDASCRGFLTRQLAGCPTLSAGLSMRDMMFITDTCNIDPRNRPSKTEGADAGAPEGQGFYALSAIDIEGNEQSLSQYACSVSLVVNVAQF